jgi:Ca2+-binding RTX toxin-like protein
MAKTYTLTEGRNKFKGTDAEEIVFGLGGKDEINTRGGNDVLSGGSGNDQLLGGNGIDKLIGGAGKDVLVGGAGLDYASYSDSISGVTVNLSDATRNTGDARGDRFDTIEGLIGSAQNDNLTGDTQNNTIFGGSGDDVIDGAGGDDLLWGDSEEVGVDGADTFVFTGAATTDLKRIMDFDVQDHIELSRSGFGLHIQYQLTVGTTLVIAHANPTAGTDSPTFLVEQSTGNLYFDADGNGTAAAQLIANVQFHSQEYLELNDFMIV